MGERLDNVYLIVQLLEKKTQYTGEYSTKISREMLDKEYTMVGYTSVWVNNLDDTIGYGTFTLDLYAPPVYVEELDPSK